MSGTMPQDVVTTLILGSPDVLYPRFWAGESIRVTARFTDPASGDPADATGVSYAFRYPDGSEAIAPEGFAVRLGIGVWVAAIVPALSGTWNVVVRCLGPTMSVGVDTFEVVPLPAGAPLPPERLVTSDDGLFIVLSQDGAAITY